MLLADSHFTPVIGVDIHFTTLPPYNPFHPYVGIVIDPFDYIPFIGGTIQVNGIKRGVSDTSGVLLTLFHIPLFTPPWAMTPIIGHESMNFFAAQNVYGDGSRFSPKGYMVMTCNDVGIPLSLSLGKMKVGKKMLPFLPTIFAPTAYSLPIPYGAPVTVGGPYVPDWTGALTGLLASFGFSSLLKIARKGMKIFNKFLKKGKGPNKLSNILCKMGLEPVNFVNGSVVYSGADVELPGPIPFQWTRNWYSDSEYEGILGYGVHCNYDRAIYLEPDEGCIGIRMDDGRVLVIEWINVGDEGYIREEKITIRNKGDRYEIFDHQDFKTYTFGHYDGSNNNYLLTEIRNASHFTIQFSYNQQHRLLEIIDSAGRRIETELDRQGRITGLNLNNEGNLERLVSYSYGEAGDMLSIADALDQETVIDYDNHLMVKKTDRNGQSFYWEYDGPKTGARCVHTWGDGGWQEGWLAYFPEQGYNTVKDANGAITTYYYTPEQLVVAEKDALGGMKRYEYTEYMELYREYDPEGNMTGYTYDDRGHQTSIVYADGSEVKSVYDENGRLQLVTDAEGNSRIYTYKKDNPFLLSAIIESDNAITSFEYNELGLLSVVEKEENHTYLFYDEQHNLSKISNQEGQETHWSYDYKGQPTGIERPNMGDQRFHYDSLGRVVNIETTDRNRIRLKYNAYDEVIEAQDKEGIVRFEYTPLGSLQMREQNGKRVYFNYDRMEQLQSLRNEHGEQYSFYRNLRGDIVREQAFDGIVKEFMRDRAGKVLRIHRPGGRWTDYEYDLMGKVVRASYYDGTWETFNYNKNGLLVEARNQDICVRIERDSRGRIVREVQHSGLGGDDGFSVISHYDRQGNRIRVESSLGASIDQTFSTSGQVQSILAQTEELKAHQQEGWKAEIKYNSLGQEIERVLTGSICSRTEYDDVGRPIRHRVTNGARQEQLNKCYHWDPNYRLHRVFDDISKGSVRYSYDAIGSLASVKYEDGSYDYKLPDEIGNIYRDKYRKTRVYGSGGRLLKDEDWQYIYDEEGNLIYKTRREIHGAMPKAAVERSRYTLRTDIEPLTTEAYYIKENKQIDYQWQAGDWAYLWSGNGMLREVQKPNGEKVCFEYDALGRRTAKIKVADHRINRYIWDKNVLLHEWSYAIVERPKIVTFDTGQLLLDRSEPVVDLITWVYEEGSYVPSAKLIGDQRYSILSDYLGRPIQAYDDQGLLCWSTSYGIYGELRQLRGDASFIPFRQLGQYDDLETGLYYNRFRYYDPDQGNYISQDPIGLAGGNPTLYGYVHDSNSWVDVFGLDLITVYRFDERSPTEIKSGGGFHAYKPDANVDLFDYADTNKPSQYISTTYSLQSAKDFSSYYNGDGYIYKIEIDDSKGLDVNKVLGESSPFKNEKEFAVLKRIGNENIQGHIHAKDLIDVNDVKWKCH